MNFRWSHPTRGLCATLVPLFVAILLVAGCFEKPLSPVAPVWDVTVNVPLINRTYSVNQIVEKDPTLLHSDPSGLIVYSNTQQFTAISVHENLKVDPASEYYQSRIGSFSIKTPVPVLRRISAVELNPSLSDLQGQAITIPSFNFSIGPQSFPLISELERATLVSGQVTLTFINRLPIPVDNISVTVHSQYGLALRFDQSAVIQPNDSVKRIFSLANLIIGNAFTLNLSGRYPGTATSVVIDTAAALFVRLDFSSDIKASEAIAKLPTNTLTTLGSFLLDDSTKIDFAEIKTGSMTVTLNNSLGISGYASLIIANLRQPNGGAFRQIIPFYAGQQDINAFFPLNGYSVQSPDGSLSYTVTAQTFDTGNNLVAIDSLRTISGSVRTSVIYFQNFQGKLKPTNVGVSVSRSIDVGDINRVFSGALKFSQARVSLTVTSPARFSLDLNATLTGKSSATGQTAILSLPLDQRRISFPQTTITLTETNSNIVAFLNSFADKLLDEVTLSGNAVLNPNYTSGSVSATDSLGVRLSVDIPLKIGVLNGIARDTTEINISPDERRELDRTNYGKVFFEIQNGLPAAIQVSVDWLDAQRSNLLTLPKASQPVLAVSGAQVDAQGRVVVPASSTSFLELISDDVSKFKLTKYVAYAMTVGTSGGGTVPVQFRTSDSVRVRAYSTLSYRVNFK